MTTNDPLTKRFKFIDKSIRAIPNNPTHFNSKDLELSDTQGIGLKCLVGKQVTNASYFTIPTMVRS